MPAGQSWANFSPLSYYVSAISHFKISYLDIWGTSHGKNPHFWLTWKKNKNKNENKHRNKNPRIKAHIPARIQAAGSEEGLSPF